MVRTRSGKRTRSSRSPVRSGPVTSPGAVHACSGTGLSNVDADEERAVGTDETSVRNPICSPSAVIDDDAQLARETAHREAKVPSTTRENSLGGGESLLDEPVGRARDTVHARTGQLTTGDGPVDCAIESLGEATPATLPLMSAGDVEDGTQNGSAAAREKDTRCAPPSDFFLPCFVVDPACAPELFIGRTDETSSACRQIIRTVFETQTAFSCGRREARNVKGLRNRSKWKIPLGPLSEIDVRPSFEIEQVWEEILLRNVTLVPYLDKAVRRFCSMDAREVGAVPMDDLPRGNKRVYEPGFDPVSTFKDADEGSLPDSLGRGPGALPASEVGNDGDVGGERTNENPIASLRVEGCRSPEQPRKRVRFNIDRTALCLKENDSGEPTRSSGAHGTRLEDGFFNVADMEAFADEAEGFALEGRLREADEEKSTGGTLGLDFDSEDSDLNETSLGRGARDGSSGGRTTEDMRYEDFFDRPEEIMGSADQANELEPRSNPGEKTATESALEETPLERHRKELRASIKAIEDANVSKKPWQLQGEVQAHARPVNSLLEADLEHEVVSRAKLSSAPDQSATIEDIVKQRVYDGLFDDVVRKLPVDYREAKEKSMSRVSVPEVSQEKPAEGLADMYEREFAEQREKLSKAADAASAVTKHEEDAQDTVEQTEVNRLYKRLSNKLDALASLHFTPPPPKMPAEMEVKSNLPALNAEEAIPEAVSDAALLAPKEVHAVSGEALEGAAERNKEDRRREHRAKKRRISAGNKRKTADAVRKQMADPDVAAAKRAERTLQRPGKLLKPVKNPGLKISSDHTLGRGGRGTSKILLNKASKLTKSAQFFANLQTTVENDISAKVERTGTAGAATQKSIRLKT